MDFARALREDGWNIAAAFACARCASWHPQVPVRITTDASPVCRRDRARVSPDTWKASRCEPDPLAEEAEAEAELSSREQRRTRPSRSCRPGEAATSRWRCRGSRCRQDAPGGGPTSRRGDLPCDTLNRWKPTRRLTRRDSLCCPAICLRCRGEAIRDNVAWCWHTDEQLGLEAVLGCHPNSLTRIPPPYEHLHREEPVGL